MKSDRTPKDKLDALEFLDGVEGAEEAGELLGELVLGLGSKEPPVSLRSRLLSTLDSVGRFDLYAAEFARIFDVSDAEARELLKRVDEPDDWHVGPPPATLKWFNGGPKVADAMTGFVKIPAGAPFPHHEHLGHETVFVLQGTLTDSGDGQTVRAGHVATMEADTAHAFTVPEGGPPLIYALALHGGVKIGDFIIRGPDDLG